MSTSTLCLAGILLARLIALPTISPPTSCGVALGYGAGLELGHHIQQVGMNRFSRSASSMMVARRSALAASSSDFAIAQGARRAEHGGEAAS